MRDRLRCVLPDADGSVRSPALVPTYRVDMGSTARARLFHACPIGTLYGDPFIRHSLTVSGLVRRFNRWPPGREDPRLLEAVLVIQREHDVIDAERRAPPAE